MHTPTTRLLIAVPAGITVTLGVLLLMTALIARLPLAIPERPAGPTLGFLPELEERPPEALEPVAERIPPPPVPPTTEPEQQDPEAAPAAVRVAALRPRRSSSTPTLGVAGDSPLVAMILVEPTYPPGPAARGLEGYVVVEFTVLADGTTSDIVVVESSSRAFERAAISAAERFRYRPKTVDEQAEAVRGVRYRFRFRMDD